MRPEGSLCWLTTIALSVLVVSCAQKASPVSPETQPKRFTQIPLPGYVYDVAVGEGAAWVTSRAGLFRIDLVTNKAVNVLPRDYLFKVASGNAAVWITTGSDGRVLRVSPQSNRVVARINVGAGPVTELTVSEDSVWVSATSDLVRIDPVTNEVVARLQYDTGFGDIAFGEGALWVIAGANEEGEVWRIDPTTNEVLQRLPLPDPHFWNEIAVGEGAIWVTSSPIVRGDADAMVRLNRIDPATGAIIAEIPVGMGPSGLGPGERAGSYSALAVGEGSVWVHVDFESILVRIDPGSGVVSETLEEIVGRSSDVGPALIVGAGAVWLTSTEALTRISLQR